MHVQYHSFLCCTLVRQLWSSTLAFGASANNVIALMELSLTSELMSLSSGTSLSRAEASSTAYLPFVITEML